MAHGEIRDGVAGGFHRYSTDAEWSLPHVEKMLYDNAQLGRAYVSAYAAAGDRFAIAVKLTIDEGRHINSNETRTGITRLPQENSSPLIFLSLSGKSRLLSDILSISKDPERGED